MTNDKQLGIEYMHTMKVKQGGGRGGGRGGDFSFVYLTIFLGNEGKESYKKRDISAPKLQELIKCPDTQGPVTHYRFFHTTYFV